ncbi:helix-turn-helix transcriptional regulator [Streptomyces sp. NPDC001941]|uniref:helix-turn-helix domain-containing protein n=1 Tax=Streptomyces sp. NPDC001941 TaxID=3154659 RepID=UPI00331DE0B8
MPGDSALEVGGRIAAIRQSKRMSQPVLARCAYLSLATVRAIEQGRRNPSDSALESIAAALGVDASRLASGYTGTEHRVHLALPRMSASLAGFDFPQGPPARDAAQLRAAVDDALKWRLAAQYGKLALAAPTLLTDTIRHLHTATARDRPAAARFLATVARAADAVAYKHGARDLSARLIDLMRWACEHADDPLLTAHTAYVRTEVFFAAREHRAGLQALEAALDEAPPAYGTATAAARGALHMRAAVVAARIPDHHAADTHLREARRLSETVGEGIYGGTAFGPSSVRIHELSLTVAMGQAHVSRALKIAANWSPPDDLPAERRSGFYIELSRAQLWAGRPQDAFESLKAARRVAPQHTREHPWARENAATLRRLRRSGAEELTAFAEWVGAL